MINIKLVLLVNKLERLWTAIQIGDIYYISIKPRTQKKIKNSVYYIPVT